MYRTFLRLFRLAPPCSVGCEERATEVFFSRESIVWWYVGAWTPLYLLHLVFRSFVHLRETVDR